MRTTMRQRGARLEAGLAEIHPGLKTASAFAPAFGAAAPRRADRLDGDLDPLAGDGALDVGRAAERGVGIEQADHGSVLCQAGMSSSKRRSGRSRRASSAPTSSRTIEPTKGSAQLPVASISTPKKTGEMMPARPKPKFIMPLAVPAWRGAMSIGTDQIGATTSSAKKKARLRQAAGVGRWWIKKT